MIAASLEPVQAFTPLVSAKSGARAVGVSHWFLFSCTRRGVWVLVALKVRRPPALSLSSQQADEHLANRRWPTVTVPGRSHSPQRAVRGGRRGGPLARAASNVNGPASVQSLGAAVLTLSDKISDRLLMRRESQGYPTLCSRWLSMGCLRLRNRQRQWQRNRD